jgi:hypothetical protein
MPESKYFNVAEIFPRRIFDAITETRVNHPEVISEQAPARRKRARARRHIFTTVCADKITASQASSKRYWLVTR